MTGTLVLNVGPGPLAEADQACLEEIIGPYTLRESPPHQEGVFRQVFNSGSWNYSAVRSSAGAEEMQKLRELVNRALDELQVADEEWTDARIVVAHGSWVKDLSEFVYETIMEEIAGRTTQPVEHLICCSVGFREVEATTHTWDTQEAHRRKQLAVAC